MVVTAKTNMPIGRDHKKAREALQQPQQQQQQGGVKATNDD